MEIQRVLFIINPKTSTSTLQAPSVATRLAAFTRFVTGNGPCDKGNIKRDAWVLKKFCVLVKRKLTRGQAPRNETFSRLLAQLSDEDDSEEDRVFRSSTDYFQTVFKTD